MTDLSSPSPRPAANTTPASWLRPTRDPSPLTEAQLRAAIQGAPAAAPQMFEELRQFASDAVEQLVREMAAQQVNYRVPADNLLALLERVAAVKETSTWDIWEDWALRHALPVHALVQTSQTRALTAADREVLGKRLRDLFGYALLGLILVERERSIDKIDETR